MKFFGELTSLLRNTQMYYEDIQHQLTTSDFMTQTDPIAYINHHLQMFQYHYHQQIYNKIPKISIPTDLQYLSTAPAKSRDEDTEIPQNIHISRLNRQHRALLHERYPRRPRDNYLHFPDTKNDQQNDHTYIWFFTFFTMFCSFLHKITHYLTHKFYTLIYNNPFFFLLKWTCIFFITQLLFALITPKVNASESTPQWDRTKIEYTHYADDDPTMNLHNIATNHMVSHYDCTEPSNMKVFTTLDVEPCQVRKPDVKYTTTVVTLHQKRYTADIEGYMCKASYTIQRWHCGAWSHSSMATDLHNAEIPLKLTKQQCKQAIPEKIAISHMSRIQESGAVQCLISVLSAAVMDLTTEQPEKHWTTINMIVMEKE